MLPGPSINQWTDYGLGAPEEPSYSSEPEDWRMYGLPNYGAYAHVMGIMSGEEVPLIAEATQELYGNRVLARTPMLEVLPEDYNYIKVMRRPFEGMLALGDDGQVYEYDGTLGFFKKLFRRIKKAVRKVGRRIKKGVHKVLKKIPGGKYLIKLGKKVYKIAKKIVKPLVKFVGKYAAKLAPVAALIPGYGPAIAAGLYAAGKIANLMTEYGVKITGAAHKIRKLAFPSGKKSKKFIRALKKAAKKEAHRQRKHGPPKPMGRHKGRPARGRIQRGRLKTHARGIRHASRLARRRA